MFKKFVGSEQATVGHFIDCYNIWVFYWLLAPIGALVNDKEPISPLFIFILSCFTNL
jgi:hypothetical protein